jgi:hypothetical protein
MRIELTLFTFVATMLFSNIIDERASRYLSPQQKAGLLEAYSGFRAYRLVPIVIVLGAYYALLQYSDISVTLLSICFWVAVIVFVAIDL